jgi:hypothetical protein
VDRAERRGTVRERTEPQRWSVTVQHRWEDSEPVVALAVGGWDCVGPALTASGIIVRETVDPVEAVEAALTAAAERGLAVDLESALTYGDWPDATAAGTGYSPAELRAQAQLWLDCQPQCEECDTVAAVSEYWDPQWDWSAYCCSEPCAERSWDRWTERMAAEDPVAAELLAELRGE